GREEEMGVGGKGGLGLQRVHDELEEVVAKRTAELAQANESLERTLREMQRQEVYLDELFDLAPAAVVLTSLSPAKNLRINREFTRMFGYTSEEAVGKRLRNLIAPDELAPADLTTNPDLLAGKTVEREVVRQRKDGTRFHAHITAKRIRLGDSEDAAYLIYRDITERKLAEEALRLSESRFRNLTELSNDFFWETDAAHRYTAFERGRAYPGRWHAASKTGKAPWEIAYATPHEAAWNAHRATIAARQRFFDFGFSRIENGEERFFEL